MKKIGIISLGLIGGSIFKCLSKKGYDICACTRNLEAVESAKNYTDEVSDNISIVKDCDVIFVCSPMSKTVEMLDKLENIVSEKTIVADVCSLKEFVTQKKRPYIFIGSHPMAGTENSGFEASDSNLFKGAKWVLTPDKSVKQDEINTLSSIIKDTGAEIIITEAKKHDKAAALISHMPMLVAQALMKTALENKGDNNLTLKLAASGFRDMTRLALSNTRMAEDMVTLNSKNITEALIELMENARSLLNDDYASQIKDIKHKRKNMYNSEGKNISN